MFNSAAQIGCALLLVGCCQEPERPCVPWAKIGETYTVELGEPVPPSPEDMMPIEPCPVQFDVGQGDVIKIRATSKVDLERCGGACYPVAARVLQAGVLDLGPTTEAPYDLGPNDFIAQHLITLSGICGTWTFGIDLISPRYGQANSGPSNYVAHREFAVRTVTESGCDPMPAFGRCGDVWFAEVRDSDGNVVSD